MIVKVGVDLVSIERIRKSMENPRFVQKVLDDRELKTPLTPEYVAGRWAAKEALVKCLGGVISDYVIGSEPNGAPALLSNIENGLRAHISISHDAGFAVGFAVVERDC